MVLGLRILVTNLFIARGSGSEAVVELLADGLRRLGHQPLLYAPLLGEQAWRMRRRGHVVVDRLAELPARPDVMHLQHATPAAMALAAFPGVPAVQACHSALFEVEAPRPHPGIGHWIAVDDLCAERCLSRGVPADRLSVILNAVDMLRFRARPALPPRPGRALLLTKTSEQERLVRRVAADLGLELDALGPGVGEVTDRLEEVLPRYDIVVATARMALEAAAVGCAVVVGDGRGFAGLLTTRNLDPWRRLNLGAGLLAEPMTEEGLRAAFAAYDPADAAAVSARLRAEAGAEDFAAAHVEAYRTAMAAPAPEPGAAAAATAAWLEDLLPSPAQRAWREVAREIGDMPAAPVEVALAGLAARAEEQARIVTALREEGAAGAERLAGRLDRLPGELASQAQAQATAELAARLGELEGRIAGQLAALPGPRADRALRAAWRRLVPAAIRRPLHRWRRAVLNPGGI